MFIHYIKQIFYKLTRKGLVCMIIKSVLKVSWNTFLGVLINIFFADASFLTTHYHKIALEKCAPFSITTLNLNVIVKLPVWDRVKQKNPQKQQPVLLENTPGKHMREMWSNVSVWATCSSEVKLLGTADLLLQGHLEGKVSRHSLTARSCRRFDRHSATSWMCAHFKKVPYCAKFTLLMYFNSNVSAGWPRTRQS